MSKPVNLTKLDSVIRQWLMPGGPARAACPPTCPESSTDNGPAAAIEIPGVDTGLGMDLFEDDLDMFVDFLRSYAEGIPAELDKLRDVSGQTLPAYAIDVHTIKGASAGIGASGLAETAKRLEGMAKAGDLAGVLAENEGFLREADTLTADIRAWLAKSE